MGQAFFTLSLGIGAMAIFGSYIGKERRLFGEAINVGVLDTFVAFTSGLIIFPSAFAFGVNPDSGPQPDLCHPAQCVQRHARRTAVGRAVLRVPVLCRPVHRHRRV